MKFYKSLDREKKFIGKRIGYVVSLFPVWSEVFVLNEIIELGKRGFDISIFSIRNDLQDFIQTNAKPFQKKTDYPSSPGVILFTLYWAARKPFTLFHLFFVVLNRRDTSLKILLANLWCICVGAYFAGVAKRRKIEHIHAHFASYPATVAWTISKLSGIPFTFTAHAHDIFLDKALLKNKAKDAKGIVAISNYNKKYIEDYCGGEIAPKTRVIHYGVDLAEAQCFPRKKEEDKHVILSVGRLAGIKGFPDLVKACNVLKDKIAFKCRIIGDGPLRRDIERLIGDLGLEDYVFLDGVLDNIEVRKRIAESTIFVLPSIWDNIESQDGIPFVLMEAMSQGIPVISTRISGIPELVEDGKTGLLVTPGHYRELASNILLLLNDKNLRDNLSLHGRIKIENEFDISLNVDRLIRLFEEPNI